jgi:hypothetical protein
MNINIDEHVSKLLPWDLNMTIQGETYATKRPAVSLIARLSQAASLGTEESLGLIRAMFQEPGPDVGEWGPELLPLVIAEYLRYFNEHVRKNARRVAEILRPATPTQDKAAATTEAAGSSR